MARLTLAPVALAALVMLALSAAPAGSRLTSVTLGQTIPNSEACGEYWFFQTSPMSYTVPAGDWVVTSWSTYAGDNSDSGNMGGYMSLMIFRAASGGTYDIVGESPVEALNPNSLNTFTLASPIPVQGGDLLGMYENYTNCGITSGGGTLAGGYPPEPQSGANITPAWTNPNFLSNVAATLDTSAATLTVTKHVVSNVADTGRFNLREDGTTYASNIGDGGTTGAVSVSVGDHTVSETAGTNTSLGKYTTRIECSDGTHGYGTSLTGVRVGAGTHVNCTITNTRKLFKT